MRINEAIILAGGKGTRLRSVITDIPKCMAPVQEKAFITFILDFLNDAHFSKVIISVGYLKEYIINNLGNSFKNIEIAYSMEESPLGTGGAIKAALELCKNDNVFVLNGDTYFRPELKLMAKEHETKQADITIAVKHMNDVSRYGSVNFNNTQEITSFCEKNQKTSAGFINGGIYLINKSIFHHHTASIFSIENDFFKNKINVLKMQVHISDAFFLDIGIPEDYSKASVLLNFEQK